MKDQFSKKDTTLILICIVLTALSLWYGLSNFNKAFPEHAIEFEVGRKESKTYAERFLDELNLDASGYHHAVAFNYDRLSKTFIEKEVSVEESGDLLNREFRIWHWSNRWFKPLTKEEINVNITPKGEVTLFEHIIPEDEPGNSLSIDAARSLCHIFLTKTLNIDITKWEFIEEKTELKPDRVDYLFTYKKKGVEVYNATYRFEILVQGDKIGRYKEYLKVPEYWKRDYQHLRSLNFTTSTTAYVFFIIILLAAFITFIARLSKRDVRLKTALIFSSIAFTLELLSFLNRIPINIYNFDTNQSFGNFYTNIVLNALIQSFLFGALVFFITVAGESLYRQHYPKKISLTRTFSIRGLHTKRFLLSLFSGITLAFVFIAFQTLFYIIAKRYGSWAPAEIPYSEIINTAFPWIFVLMAGFAPAVIEEFTFRMFFIPFLEKILKSKILAVLIPAVIWGFAHANYPNQPFWIRGAEVGIFGIIIGVVFLKFNIFTVLVWHYTVDALYSSIVLLKTGETYLVISGAISAGIMLIPLIYCIFAYIKNRGFEPVDGLTNASEGTVKSEDKIRKKEEAVAEIQYKPLSKNRVKLAVILGLIFLTAYLIPANRVGEFVKYPVAKKEIIKTAKAFLESKGVDPLNYRHAISTEKSYKAEWGKYILEREPIDKLNTILSQHLTNSTVWHIRFFQPLEKEEYRVYVNTMENVVVGFNHILPEDAEGYTLSKETAKLHAEQFIAQQHFDLSKFELKESFSQKLQNRTDHTFLFEARENHPANVEDGRLRLKIVVKGDEIAAFERFYKLPEEWSRLQTERTTADSIHLVVQILFIAAIAVFLILFFSKKFKGYPVQWRRAVFLSAAIAVLVLIENLTSINYAYVNYNTSWSFGLWNFLQLLLLLLQSLAIAVLLFFLLVAVMSLYQNLSSHFGKERRWVFSKDAILSSTILIIGLFSTIHIGNLIASAYPSGILKPSFHIPTFLTSNLPLLKVIAHISFMSILTSCVIGIIAFCSKNIIKKTLLSAILVAIIVFIYLPTSVDTGIEFLVSYISVGLTVLWICFALRFFLRGNIPAYLYSAIGFFTIKTAIEFIRAGSPFGSLNAYILLLLLLAGILRLLTEKRVFKLPTLKQLRQR